MNEGVRGKPKGKNEGVKEESNRSPNSSVRQEPKEGGNNPLSISAPSTPLTQKFIAKKPSNRNLTHSERVKRKTITVKRAKSNSSMQPQSIPFSNIKKQNSAGSHDLPTLPSPKRNRFSISRKPSENLALEKAIINCKDPSVLCEIILQSKLSFKGLTTSAGIPYLHLMMQNVKNFPNLTIILALLSKDTSLEDNYKGLKPIHYAIKINRLDLVKLFIEHNASIINQLDEAGNTPLHSVITSRHKDMALFKYLLEQTQVKANLMQQNNKGYNLLHLIAIHSQIKSKLIDFACLLKDHIFMHSPTEWTRLINQRDNTENTALHSACENLKLSIAFFLVENNANLNAKNKKGATPLHCLLERTSKVLVEKELLNIVDYFLLRELNILAINHEGNTLLHLCAQYGHEKIVYSLFDYINNGLYINSQDSLRTLTVFINQLNTRNECALLLAGFYSNWPIVNQLLSLNALTDLKNLENKTIHHYIDTTVHIDKRENTLLHAATLLNHYYLLEFILKEKILVNINTKNITHETPLLMAVGQHFLKLAKLFLENQALVDIKNHHDDHAWSLAWSLQDWEMVELMLQYPTQVKVKDSNLVSLNESIEQYLSITDSFKNTILHHLAVNPAYNDCFNLVDFILSNHLIDMNALNQEKNSALHLAVMHNNLPLIMKLKFFEANTGLTNIYHQTPLSLAKDMKLNETIKILESRHDHLKEKSSMFNLSMFMNMVSLSPHKTSPSSSRLSSPSSSASPSPVIKKRHPLASSNRGHLSKNLSAPQISEKPILNRMKTHHHQLSESANFIKKKP